MLPHLKISPDHTICECGCGTGSGVEILLHYYPNLNKILANDISESMIIKAKEKNLKNTELHLASCENLPYEYESCDRYISNLTLHFVENPEIMIKEAFRVLKSPGIAVFSVPGKADHLNLLKVIGRSLKNAGLQPDQQRNPFHLSEKAKINGLAKDAGFNKIRSFFTSVPFLSDSVEDIVEIAAKRDEAKVLKGQNTILYEKYLDSCRKEVESIWNAGDFISFDVLVLVAEK